MRAIAWPIPDHDPKTIGDVTVEQCGDEVTVRFIANGPVIVVKMAAGESLALADLLSKVDEDVRGVPTPVRYAMERI
jgi:hypothetical protein